MTQVQPNPQPRKRGRPSKAEVENVSEFSDENQDEVSVDVQPHAETSTILNEAARLVGSQGKELSRNQKYKLSKKAQKDDFSTIVITLLTLGISAWNAPEEIKPNEDEVQAFSVPATRMLLRHFPITAKLSQDALDVIGMIGALSAYSVRTRSGWAQYSQARKTKAIEAEAQSITNDADPFQYPQPAEPIPAGEGV